MKFVIQHPGRIDLFCNGAGEYVSLKDAKQYDGPVPMEPGEKMIATPAKQPVHPVTLL